MMGLVGVLILAVGVFFVIVIAASGGDDDGPSVPSSDNNSDGGGNGNSASTGSGICRGDIFYTYGADPATILDPIQVRDAGTAEYIVEIFGGLVSLDLDLNVIPDIAESWEILDGGTRYVFTLRDDVVFYKSGRRVTADDVKYSLERAADPVNNSPTVTLYLGSIVGVDEKFGGSVDSISGVKVIDEQTLEITLEEPIGYFLQALTYPVAFVVDQEQIESDPRNWTRSPNGTGPFRLKTFKPAEEIVLIPNQRYHLGVPLLEQVVFELSGGSLLTRYENEEIHVGIVPALDLEAVKAGDSPLSDQYYPSNQMALSYLGLNVNQAPFDDIKVRQAMALAIDRDVINEVLLYNAWRVADGILPPEMPGYSESISTFPTDAERARSLLAESSYAGNVPRIVLTYAGVGGDPPDILQAFQQQWEQTLGLEIELQATEYSAYLRELRRGTFQMYSAGWIADYPDPEDFLAKLFQSDSPQNELGYKNDEVDALLIAARTEPDQAVRFEMYRQAEELIINDAAVIPTFWPIDHQLVSSCVQNWPTVSLTVPKYRYISISDE
jgi:oligopeptide transport system substrate-binding protein